MPILQNSIGFVFKWHHSLTWLCLQYRHKRWNAHGTQQNYGIFLYEITKIMWLEYAKTITAHPILQLSYQFSFWYGCVNNCTSKTTCINDLDRLNISQKSWFKSKWKHQLKECVHWKSRFFRKWRIPMNGNCCRVLHV